VAAGGTKRTGQPLSVRTPASSAKAFSRSSDRQPSRASHGRTAS